MKRLSKAMPLVLALAAGMVACEKRDAAGTNRTNGSNTSNTTTSTTRDTTVRDTTKEKPTKPDATSQANNQADLDVTQAIRKAVQARDDISAGTKGTLVIVTEKGTVTLKGPVATEAEKTTIGEIATSNASGRTVDNQLAVKPASP